MLEGHQHVGCDKINWQFREIFRAAGWRTDGKEAKWISGSYPEDQTAKEFQMVRDGVCAKT